MKLVRDKTLSCNKSMDCSCGPIVLECHSNVLFSHKFSDARNGSILLLSFSLFVH